jgi:hypothetical protein
MLEIALGVEATRRRSPFADEKVTSASLDRLTHHAHILTTRGDSYRAHKRKARDRQPLSSYRQQEGVSPAPPRVRRENENVTVPSGSLLQREFAHYLKRCNQHPHRGLARWKP